MDLQRDDSFITERERSIIKAALRDYQARAANQGHTEIVGEVSALLGKLDSARNVLIINHVSY